MMSSQGLAARASIQLELQLPSLFQDCTQTELKSLRRVVHRLGEKQCKEFLHWDEDRRKRVLWGLAESGILQKLEPKGVRLIDIYRTVVAFIKSLTNYSTLEPGLKID